MKKYCGWKNYETWNVMLWLNGTEDLNFALRSILEHCQPEEQLTYREVILILGLAEEETGDGVAYLSEKLNYNELDSAISDLQRVA